MTEDDRDRELAKAHRQVRELEEELAETNRGLMALTLDLEQRVERRTAALRQSEARYRRLVETAAEGIWQIDNELRTVFANARMAEMLGYTAKEMVGRHIREFGTEEDAENVGFLKASLRRGVTETHERRLRRRDGSTIWVLVSATSLGDAQGSVIGSFGMFTDITGRKQAEELLRLSEKRLAADLDAMTRLQKIGTLFLREGDLEPILTEIVEAAIAISGADSGDIQLLDPESSVLRFVAQRGLPPWWLGSWSHVSCGHEVWGTALARAERIIVEDVEHDPTFAGSEGMGILLRAGVRAVQSTPLVSRSGRRLGVFSTQYRTPQRPDDRALPLLDLLARSAADIIERAQTEEALVHARDNLERRVRERTAELQIRSEQLARLTSELTLAEQHERQRLAQVLHDGLQQLLVAAKFRLNVLETAADERVRQEAQELGELISDSIVASRSLTADLSPPVLKSGLAPALEWLVRWMQEKHGLDVALEVGEGSLTLAENVTVLLFQSVRELLFNVVKHAGVRQARVHVSPVDSLVHLVVTDDGVGFDTARLDRLDGRSGGFGLFVIRERLDLLGGRLEIESSPGRGSRFSLIAPLMSEAADVAPTRQPPKVTLGIASPSALADAAGRLRIVLVDDHAVVRQGLAMLLRQERSFQIVGEASDGKSAVELVRRLQPNVVLMDVTMPGMDGVEATKIIHEEWPDICVIGLSMHDDAHVYQRMRQAGASAYLNKSGPADAIVQAILACRAAEH